MESDLFGFKRWMRLSGCWYGIDRLIVQPDDGWRDVPLIIALEWVKDQDAWPWGHEQFTCISWLQTRRWSLKPSALSCCAWTWSYHVLWRTGNSNALHTHAIPQGLRRKEGAESIWWQESNGFWRKWRLAVQEWESCRPVVIDRQKQVVLVESRRWAFWLGQKLLVLGLGKQMRTIGYAIGSKHSWSWCTEARQRTRWSWRLESELGPPVVRSARWKTRMCVMFISPGIHVQAQHQWR